MVTLNIFLEELKAGLFYFHKPVISHLNSIFSLPPSPQPELFPPNSQPLLVLVNSKSGGGQGADMLAAFQRLLNPHQVYSLTEGGPLLGYVAFEKKLILLTNGKRHSVYY